MRATSRSLGILILATVCAAVIAVSATLSAERAFAERTIALGTGTVNLALTPGSSGENSIMVANTGTEPLKALLYTSDVTYDEQGRPTYERPLGMAGNFLRSPASWMHIRAPDATKIIANTPYIELDPGEQMEIDFEMRVPPNATPGDYNAIIFFEMFEEAGAEEGMAAQVTGRIGARVVLRVIGDVVDRMTIAPFSVRSFVIGDVVPYSLRIVNEGNIDKRYVPELVVLDGNDAERMRSVVETEAIVYAGNQREYVGGLKLQNASFGRFTMRAEVSYDRETGTAPGATVPERLREDRTFWVVPLWFAIAVILAIGLPVLWLSWRASVRSAERAHARRLAARSGSPRGWDVGDDEETGSGEPGRER